jgi:hypothetical protein
VNQVFAPLRSGRRDRPVPRTTAIDLAIVVSCAAAFAHLVAAPGHYIWWPAAGVFFAVLGVGQLLYGVLLVRGIRNKWFVLAGIWGTVGVILLYVVSRTIGVPGAPPVSAHGGRWVVGRSIVPNGAKYVGPLDVFTLAAELVLVVTLLSTLPARLKVRTVNQLMWIGLGLWGAALIGSAH